MTTPTATDDAATPPRWTKLVGDLANPAEQSKLMRVAVLAAVLSSIVAVLTSGIGGRTLWVITLLVIPCGSAFSYLRRDDRRPLVPLLLTLLTIALTIRFVSANLKPANPGELRGPLAELLVLLEGARSFALRSRRDLRFALASSLALMALAAAMSLSIMYAVGLVVWGTSGAVALIAGHRSELRDQAPPATGPSAGGTRAALGVGAAAAVSALAVAAVVFMVVPAARSSRFLAFTAKLPNQTSVPQPGGLSNPSLGQNDPGNGPSGDPADGAPKSFGYFGFANSLDTSVRGRPDETLVMRVRASAPDFWRGQTFDTWDGRTWTMSDQRTAVVRTGSPLELLTPAGEPQVRGEELIQTVYLERPGPNLIFAANRATHLYIPQAAVFEMTDGTIRTGVELEQGAIYTVVSSRPQATPGSLRAAGDVRVGAPADIVARYTTLPRVPQRVAELAARVTAGEATTYDKVRALESWMGSNTRYSLDIPQLPQGADAVEQFLFEDRIGFCEQIASSLVVMLRSQGVPARLAVGYTPGERNPFTGLFEVRAKDAHAWAEVYFPGVGWQAFDPTAQVPLAGDPPPDAARVGLRQYLARHLPDVPGWAAVVAGLLGGLVALALAWRPMRRILARRRRLRDRVWADVQLARLERLGSELGRSRDTGETAREYAGALQRTVLRDDRLVQVADALAFDAFSSEGLESSMRTDVEAVIDELEGSSGRR